MTNAEKLTLKKHACHIRMGVIEGTHSAGCGHPGGSLSIADVLSYLYFKELNIDPAQPRMADRDRLVLSKGHAAPALYAALAERGFFPVEELKTLRKIGSRLQGHPNMNSVPGVDMSTGSLGQGISAACGMALGAKHAGSAVNVYAILGDGEVEEGECWEAFMFAAHYGLSNLCVMLDRNHLQIDGTTETVMNSAPLEDKLRASQTKKERPKPTRGILVGDTVELLKLGTKASVLAINKDGTYQLQAGILKLTAKPDEIYLLENENPYKAKGGHPAHSGREMKMTAMPTEVDLRGMDTVEAICVLERYLDEAMRANLSTVRIIHGKGTGALRAAVQQSLKKNKFVKSFRLGVYGEGEDGVTIVELK